MSSSLSAYFHQQQASEPVSTSKGIAMSDDTRLPYQSNQWISTNYQYPPKEQILYPQNNMSVFQGGFADPVRFVLSAGENIGVNLRECYFSYKIRVVDPTGSGSTYLTKSVGNTGTLASVSGLSYSNGGLVCGSAPSSYSSTLCSMLYLRNSCAPFQKFEIKDITSNKTVESIMKPALLCEAMLSGQPPTFWDAGAGKPECDEYACQVHTFRDPKYYWAKTATAPAKCSSTFSTGDMTPSQLIPILTPESSSTATTRFMTDVQRQQTLLFPSTNTCSLNDGTSIKFFPISDFWNANETVPTRWMPLEFTFYLDTYTNAFCDVQSYLNNATNTTWTQSSYAAQFEIYDCFFHIMKYTLQPTEVPRMVSMMTTGIEIP